GGENHARPIRCHAGDRIGGAEPEHLVPQCGASGAKARRYRGFWRLASPRRMFVAGGLAEERNWDPTAGFLALGHDLANFRALFEALRTSKQGSSSMP